MYVQVVLVHVLPLIVCRSINTHSYHDPLSLARRGSSLIQGSVSSKTRSEKLYLSCCQD